MAVPTIESYIDRIAAIYPEMPRDFIEATAQAWAANADSGMAVAVSTLRADPRYETWFPGNLEDGMVHLAEGAYWLTRRQYEDAVTQLSVDKGVFTDQQYISLIKGDVDVSEWQERVRTISNEILSTADDYGLREYYAELYKIPTVSDAAILASAFEGNADAIRRYTSQALVGYSGELRGFDINLQTAASLYDANIQSQGQADELFGAAAENVPLFGALVNRHFDPDNEYDLGNFLEAAVFDDQDELQRQRRLISQERALFSAYRPLRERGGATVGLTAE